MNTSGPVLWHRLRHQFSRQVRGKGRELVGVRAGASVCVLDGVLHATGASYVA